MKIELKFLEPEEIQMLEYHIFKFFQPVMKLLLNSSVKIQDSDKKNISIRLDQNASERLRDNKSVPAVININPVKFNELIDSNNFNKFNKDKKKAKILLLTLFIGHELLHYLIGDFIISSQQYYFINYNKSDVDFKYHLLNIIKDCIINDILIELISNLYKKKWQIDVINIFKKETIDFEYICKILNYLNRECYSYYDTNSDNRNIEDLEFKLRDLICQKQESWKSFRLLYNFLKYFQDKLVRYFHYQDPLFLDLDIDFRLFNSGIEKIKVMENINQMHSYHERLKRSISSDYKGVFKRVISIIERNEIMFNIFSEVYKLMFRLGIVPCKEIVENPDCVISRGYKPVPKTGYILKGDTLQKFDYFVPKLLNPIPDNVYFYMDVSMSISYVEISEFKRGIKKINHTYPELKIKIYLWSNLVFESDIKLINIFSTGGTLFRSVINHIEKNTLPNRSNIIIITDGLWESYNFCLPGTDRYKYFFILYDQTNIDKIKNMIKTNHCEKNVKFFHYRY